MTFVTWRKPRTQTYALNPDVERFLGRIIPGIKSRAALRNVWILIEWLLRCHTGPRVIGRSFCLDRRALSRAEIGLTESQIRTAIGHLERLGLIVRERIGRTHKLIDGVLRRLPIVWRLSGTLIEIVQKTKPKSIKSPKDLHLGDRKPVSKPAIKAAPLASDSPLAKALARMGRGLALRQTTQALERDHAAT